MFFLVRRLASGYGRSELTTQYNEHNPSFPPPPIALPPQNMSEGGKTLGMDEMAAILDSGFEDPAPPAAFRSHPHPHPPSHPNGGYVSSPLNRAPISQPMTARPEYHQLHSDPSMPHSADSISSSIESRAGGSGHAKKRSGGAGRDRYGPLGPLADDDTGWGAGMINGNGVANANGHAGYTNGTGGSYGRKI